MSRDSLGQQESMPEILPPTLAVLLRPRMLPNGVGRIMPPPKIAPC